MASVFKNLLLAAALFVVDAYLINMGALAMITIFMLPVFIIRAVREKENVELYKQRLVGSGIYFISAVLIFVSIFVNNNLAVKRAELIITALDEYKNERGEYPETLYNLVPDYMDRVPHAKFSYANKRFGYATNEGRHLLSFTALPPSGTSYYVLEEGTWGFHR